MDHRRANNKKGLVHIRMQQLRSEEDPLERLVREGGTEIVKSCEKGKSYLFITYEIQHVFEVFNYLKSWGGVHKVPTVVPHTR